MGRVSPLLSALMTVVLTGCAEVRTVGSWMSLRTHPHEVTVFPHSLAFGGGPLVVQVLRAGKWTTVLEAHGRVRMWELTGARAALFHIVAGNYYKLVAAELTEVPRFEAYQALMIPTTGARAIVRVEWLAIDELGTPHKVRVRRFDLRGRETATAVVLDLPRPPGHVPNEKCNCYYSDLIGDREGNPVLGDGCRGGRLMLSSPPQPLKGDDVVHTPASTDL